MRPTRAPARTAGRLLACALLVAAAAAWAGDVFDFIPAGGRTLLLRVLGTRPPAEVARGILTGQRSREEWAGWLRDQAKSAAGLKALRDKELLTLADYLSFHMPLPAGKVPASPTAGNVEKALPPDGRDLALDYCQSCHIITVVVTQDRPREAWLGTLNKPSHIEVKLSREQREALVSYLVLNAAIPVDLVPEDLRAGGATY